MRTVTAVIFAALILSTAGLDVENDNDKNAVDPKASLRLDPFIRKALLKALSDLESSDPTTELESGETTTDELLRTGDDITETSPTTSTNNDVQYHSYVVDGRQAFINSSMLNPTLLRDNLIITTTIGNVENQVTATRPTPDPFNEFFQTKETNNLQQVRSIQNSLSSNSNQDLDDKKAPKSNTEKTTTTTLAPTTTTTTTPKPTHNDDGENIEEVNNRDVQVFPSSLVAAFTVHQDASGLPRKVEPIFQQQNRPAVTPAAPVTTNPNFATNQKPAQSEFISQQLALQRELEQKQRILEEQLRILQLQQRQHEDLLRSQQLALQQKEIQRQQLIQQEELKKQQHLQERQRLHQQNLQQVSEFQKQQLLQNNFRPQNNFQQVQAPTVSVQPSLSFDASNSVTNQQLPNREAVDFLLHLRNQQPTQFPLQQNHLPQGIAALPLPQTIGNFQSQHNFQQQQAGNFQQQNIIPFQQQQGPNFHNQGSGNFQQQPNIAFQQQLPLQNNFVPSQNFRQSNRVFRQESGTGNFGFNNNNNNANQFRFNGFQQSNNRFFGTRPGFGNIQTSDTELKQLLLQSGLSGRSQEDINIVSKVLALNHGIVPNNLVSNRLNFSFGDARRRTRKAPTRT